MRVYSVHLRRHGLEGDRDLKIIEDTFSWWALILGPLWVIWHRAWICAVGLIGLQTLISVASHWVDLNKVSQGAMSVGLAIIVGYIAQDMRRWTLSRQGFVETAIVAAPDEDTALLRYLEENNEVARSL